MFIGREIELQFLENKYEENKGQQIVLYGRRRVGKTEKEYLVGECKFKHSPFSYSEYLDTFTKLTPLKDNANFYYALFSQSGFDKKIIFEAQNSNRLYLYELKDIVNFKSKD